jgi:hypothetical protein
MYSRKTARQAAAATSPVTTNFGCHGATTRPDPSARTRRLARCVACGGSRHMNGCGQQELGRALLATALTALDLSSARKVANVSFPIGTVSFLLRKLAEMCFVGLVAARNALSAVWTRLLYTSVCNLHRCRCHRRFMRRFDRDVYVLTSQQSDLRSICYCQIGCIDRARLETPRKKLETPRK